MGSRCKKSSCYRCCLQRLQQRIGPNQDFGQRLHRHHRFYPIPTMVRIPLRQGSWPQEEALFNGPKSAAVQKKLDARRKEAEVAAALVEQFSQGRLLARIASRPGQTGRCDGYILEGKELDFYVRKLKAKKSK